MSTLTRKALQGARRGAIYFPWLALFLIPLMFYEAGIGGVALACVISSMPIAARVIDILLEGLLGPYNERMRIELGRPKEPPDKTFRMSAFLTALILAVGIGFVPAIDELFPKQPSNLSNGAALFGYIICITTLMITCERGQQTSSLRSGLVRRLAVLSILSLVFAAAQLKQGPAYRLVALLTGIGIFVSGILGYTIGFFITPSLDAISDLWEQIKKMGVALGAFVMGYTLLILMFSCIFAGLWKLDSNTFRGLSPKPGLGEFMYFSVVTAATLGYGDIVPVKPIGRLFVSIEVLLGIGWTIVGFAAAVASLSPKSADREREHEES